MANFVLQVPNNLRSFTVSASVSSNGSPPLSSSDCSGGVGGPKILELPLDKIRRPLMRTRANDPIKVQELMDSISEIGLQTPASPVVVVMKLTSVLAFQQYAAKSGVEQKKLPGITSADFLSFRVNSQFLPSYAPW
ncbi:sulfiredoxin chloroplastic/mitochondrial [Prunus yedoensis var. nudiflora]|uniref:Sulfiredoxin chloroplastic/mitochondrial n=1 Tax=Prunus yedoensis var. nudiflora TaxID=2094558 RepID=A0A314XG66_PRUYE|nr:sulfiredoxin chloroplastic/mitochondrial [Prunus yedoensis var. nudiflora]